MKPLVLLVLTITSLLFIAFSSERITANGIRNFLNYSVCNNPIPYRIGIIDSGYDLDSKSLKTITQKAADVWNDMAQKTLFFYDPRADFTVNLVYDNRQELTSQINQKENSLSEKKADLKSREIAFNEDAQNFEKQVQEYKKTVSSWNSLGGAPPEEYDRLIETQNRLKAEAERLNQEAVVLNQSARDFNQDVGNLNQTINTFNNEISLRPEEGLYYTDPQHIDIFFYADETELLHTLIHEFGHALTLDHADDKVSLMYPYTTDVITPNKSDYENLAEACRPKSIWERAHTNISLILDNYFEAN